MPRGARGPGAAVAADMAAARHRPGRPSLPHDDQAAHRVRGQVDPPLRRPRGARVLPCTHPGGQRAAAGAAGRGVQHRLPGVARRPRHRGNPPRHVPEQGWRADQGRDPRRPAAGGPWRGGHRGARAGGPLHHPVLPPGRSHPRRDGHQHEVRWRLPAAAGRRRRLPVPHPLHGRGGGRRAPTRNTQDGRCDDTLPVRAHPRAGRGRAGFAPTPGRGAWCRTSPRSRRT